VQWLQKVFKRDHHHHATHPSHGSGAPALKVAEAQPPKV